MQLDFKKFCTEVEKLFNKLKKNSKGNNADYIGELANIDPDLFSISLCSINGDEYSIGDSDFLYTMQSTSKPLSYCFALEALGEKKLHKYVGKEPSGKEFNDISFGKSGLPHNPMINMGAIVILSMLKSISSTNSSNQEIFAKWNKLLDEHDFSYDKNVYLSEKTTANRNYALAYFLQERNALYGKHNIEKLLNLYFRTCSITTDTRIHARLAAILANAGTSPFNNKIIFSKNTTQDCLSLMFSCGLYDYSGEFAFNVGLPAKSGVSGAIILVIPNVMGIAIFSPRLDQFGNSVRGVEFCKQISKKFGLNIFNNFWR
jgi:glutaminase